MPMYEFECKRCEYVYAHLFSTFEKSKEKKELKKVKCPECNSASKKRVLSSPSFAFSQPEDTDRFKNSHDYRFYHNHEKEGGTRDQRKMAEAMSHMGPDPYNDTSEKDINLDTGIHDAETRSGLT